MSTFQIKRNDRRRSIEAELYYPNDPNLVLDLTDAQEVVMNMTNTETGELKIDRGACRIVTVVKTGTDKGPRVAYDWADGDTDTAGEYTVEWEVVDAAGDPETFPSDSDENPIVEIDPDMG
jgi:hypothetical protein